MLPKRLNLLIWPVGKEVCEQTGSDNNITYIKKKFISCGRRTRTSEACARVYETRLIPSSCIPQYLCRRRDSNPLQPSEWQSDMRPLTPLLHWSGRRDSNSQLSAWKADALPLSYYRKLYPWRDSNSHRQDSKSCAIFQLGYKGIK